MNKKEFIRNECNRITSHKDRITTISFVMLVTVFLLFTGAFGYVAITSYKYVIFLLFSTVMLVSCLNSTIFKNKTNKVGNTQKTFFKIDTYRFVSLYILFTIISAITSKHQSIVWLGANRFEGAITIFLYGIIFMIFSRHGVSTNVAILTTALSTTVFSFIGILQLLGMNPFNLYPYGTNYFDGNIKYSGEHLTTIGNVDLVSAFYSLVIPFFIALLVMNWNENKYYRGLLIPISLHLFVLLKMSVAAGIVGVTVAVTVLTILLLSTSKKKTMLVSLIIILLLMLFTMILYCYDFKEGIFHEIYEILHGRFSESFGSGRLYIWREVIKRVPENLLFGTGPDSMILESIPPFERYDEANNVIYIANIDTAHSEYLNILFNQGLFALISYLGAVMCFVYNLFKYKSSNKMLVAYGVGMIGYLTQACFGISVCSSATFFWVFWGLFEYEKKSTKEF